MKYWMIVLLAGMLVACGEKTEEGDIQSGTQEQSVEAPTAGPATVTGTLTNGNGSLVQLNYVSTGQLQNKATATVGPDGVFTFTVALEEPGFYNIALSETNSCLLYLEPGSNTTLRADANDLFGTYTLEEAGKDSELIQNYFTEFNKVNKQMQEISKKMNELDFSADAERQALVQESEVLSKEFDGFKNNFLESNPDSPMLITIMAHFDPAKDMDKIDQIVESVKRNFPNSVYTNVAQKTRDDMHLAYMTRTAGDRIQPGKEAPDLEFPNPFGETIRLSDLRGKVVLLDFWASWCKPCRQENPNVVRLYNQYKDKGFEVFSFSLDNDPTRWKNAIQQDGLIWPSHASDLRQWQTAAIPLYGFRGIPYTVLIDENGKIIETNLRGIELEQKLKALFG